MISINAWNEGKESQAFKRFKIHFFESTTRRTPFPTSLTNAFFPTIIFGIIKTFVFHHRSQLLGWKITCSNDIQGSGKHDHLFQWHPGWRRARSRVLMIYEEGESTITSSNDIQGWRKARSQVLMTSGKEGNKMSYYDDIWGKGKHDH